MSPIVHGIEQKYTSRLMVQRVDALTADGAALMRQYYLPGHPVILIFDAKGQEVSRLIGLQSLEAIEQALQPILEP